MVEHSLDWIAQACGGQLQGEGGTRLITRLCTDSRVLQRGDLFVAICGENFDGHNYLHEAAAKGARAAVVQKGRIKDCPAGLVLIEVEDTREALGKLAAAYRDEFRCSMIAVVGSNGKTTTKECVAAVLRQKFDALWSAASFNNDIGVPLTLLNLEAAHQVAVMEAGTNHPGELRPLLEIIRPSFGIITCIGREHLEFFESLEGVAEEEGAIAEVLPVGGKLFLSGDEEWSKAMVRRTKAAVVRCGFSEKNDVRARIVRLDKEGTTFKVETATAGYAGEYRINLLGRHQVGNALFAIAVGIAFGLTREEIQAGLAECKPAKMRLEIWDVNGVRVLDDAYNANADSMVAALQTLRELPCRGRRVAVLGDMAELGRHSEATHEEIGRRAAELGVGQLFAVGKMAPVLARGARGAGLNRVIEFADVETAAAAVKSFIKTGDVVLLKASRAARLERISDLLRSPEGSRKN